MSTIRCFLLITVEVYECLADNYPEQEDRQYDPDKHIAYSVLEAISTWDLRETFTTHESTTTHESEAVSMAAVWRERKILARYDVGDEVEIQRCAGDFALQ
jgi:hypothetical protein